MSSGSPNNNEKQVEELKERLTKLERRLFTLQAVGFAATVGIVIAFGVEPKAVARAVARPVAERVATKTANDVADKRAAEIIGTGLVIKAEGSALAAQAASVGAIKARDEASAALNAIKLARKQAEMGEFTKIICNELIVKNDDDDSSVQLTPRVVEIIDGKQESKVRLFVDTDKEAGLSLKGKGTATIAIPLNGDEAFLKNVIITDHKHAQ